MAVNLRNIGPDDAGLLAQLFQFYLYDMSEFVGWPLSAVGRFDYPADLLSPYLTADDHIPYFIDVDGEIAGFCLIRRAPDDPSLWDMGQFFVVRKFRGKGVAADAFAQALAQHGGRWHVRVLPENTPAVRFWSTQIEDHAKGEVTRTQKLYGPAQLPMIYFTFDA